MNPNRAEKTDPFYNARLSTYDRKIQWVCSTTGVFTSRLVFLHFLSESQNGKFTTPHDTVH